jgi:hypothetical protein
MPKLGHRLGPGTAAESTRVVIEPPVRGGKGRTSLEEGRPSPSRLGLLCYGRVTSTSIARSADARAAALACGTSAVTCDYAPQRVSLQR